ncbi:DNA-binding IclR family transcriptional regulator [Brooklawnia cerclae]|uniref:DNA-binding IclR family transcriptional regulator n=2 Tax=Brooklawnia cerclae TaxID=349934 RepID=A0ABX0SI67_9ACTN|nr:DNA-binding IclR family transcriptional regulator [Brooklawnia cerclae]
MATRPGGWSLTQIASALGLAKSSTLTIMTSLEAAGLVARADNYYELDVGVLTPAGGFLKGVDIVSLFKRRIATSPLLKNEIAHLAVLGGRDVIYISRHIGRSPLPVTAQVGDRFPASITAVGAALLAQMPDDEVVALFQGAGEFPQWTSRSTPDLEALLAKVHHVREIGYAVDDGETHPNVFAFGLVVHRVGNFVQDVAISTSLSRDPLDAEHRDKALSELRTICAALEMGNDML